MNMLMENGEMLRNRQIRKQTAIHGGDDDDEYDRDDGGGGDRSQIAGIESY